MDDDNQGQASKVPAARRSSDLVERVIMHIDRMIGTEQLQPGDSVSEPDISTALGIGRVPVREAIRILAGEGLLELVPNRSARVRSVNPIEILEMLEVLTGLTVTAMRRLILLPNNQEIIATLQVNGDQLYEISSSADAFVLMKEITRFHATIFRACGNNFLLRITQRTRMNYYSHSLISMVGSAAFMEAAPQYRRIAAALARGDAVAAGNLLLKNSERLQALAIIPGLPRRGRPRPAHPRPRRTPDR